MNAGLSDCAVRIIIKEVKKQTTACVACRTRKAKCSGSTPCTRCTSKGLSCVFLQNKKRGPPAKKNVLAISQPSVNRRRRDGMVSPNFTEPILGAASEQATLLDAYFDMVGAGLPIIKDFAGLSKPTTPVQQLQQCAVLAFMNGAAGQKDKATQLISQARSLAGGLFDDFSLASASGFVLLSIFFQDIDKKLASYYAGVGRNLSQMCELKDDEDKFLQSVLFLASNILDHSIPASQRLSFITSALPPVSLENAKELPSVVALMIIFYASTFIETKIGSVLFSPDVTSIIARTASYQLEDDEQVHLLQYLEIAETIATNHQTSLRSMFSGYLFLIHGLRVIVETLSGNAQQTVNSVNNMVDRLGSTSTPTYLKISLYKDMGLMDVMLALLCRSGCCNDLVYSVQNIVDGNLIPQIQNFNFDGNLDELSLLETKLFGNDDVLLHTVAGGDDVENTSSPLFVDETMIDGDG